MQLVSLGYSKDLEDYRKENSLDTFEVGRVAVEHKERYIVKTAMQEIDAEITGNLRFSAQGRADFPAVGDWVALSVFDDSLALIHHIFPRKSILERQHDKTMVYSRFNKIYNTFNGLFNWRMI